ncbi:ABC transporter substrate-binding protein [Halalkalibacter urbisdiaboli]|uniref:ABC transporter substrate-binding protein n=1 Tax=Halalkalibacter urbisdiaboli TaxID=1960589 RepID=UPI001FDA7BE9|nr:ABC transporter substrate-binding protein [Halalkalibacter urbisdiaboli]
MGKSRLLFMMLLMLVHVLFACSTSQEETSSQGTSNPEGMAKAEIENKDEQIELEFYYPIAVGGPLTEVIEKLAADFHAEHPNIKVNPIYTGSYEDTMIKTQTAVQGGNAPDIAVLLSTELFTLKEMGAIVPLDEFITEAGGDDYINRFYPAFLENAQAEGSTWSIPFQRSTIVLYYNKEAFEAAGLDPEQPPKDWDELISYSKQLKEAGVTDWGVEIPTSGFPYWLFQAFALQNGENLMNGDGTEVYFNNPGNIEAAQLWVDLANKYEVMPKGVIDWATVPSDFIEQKTAMIYHTTGNLTNIANNAGFDFGVAYLPASKQFGSPTGGGNFYLFEDTDPKKRQAAWEFIHWATQPEQAAQWSMDTGYVAVTADAYETERLQKYTATFPQATVARDQLEFASAELSTYQNGKVYKAINDHLQAIITGEESPEDGLKAAQEEADRILAPYNN